jgi:hypothetical protein
MNLKFLQQLEEKITMEHKRIEDLQEQENKWFQESRSTKDEVHKIAERAYRLIHQEEE